METTMKGLGFRGVTFTSVFCAEVLYDSILLECFDLFLSRLAGSFGVHK